LILVRSKNSSPRRAFSLVRAMSDKHLSIFGRYHMGVFNSLGRMMTDLLGPQRQHGRAPGRAQQRVRARSARADRQANPRRRGATDDRVPTAKQIAGQKYGEQMTKQQAAQRAKKPRGLIEYGIERLGR
jgi:hypothetical protein